LQDHVQALEVLRKVRGTQNVQLEYDDITTASKVAAQVPIRFLQCVMCISSDMSAILLGTLCPARPAQLQWCS
jgi:hypothetical protein